MKCKASPELTVMLRIADDQLKAYINAKYQKARFQRFRRSTAYFNTIESFSKPEVTYFFQRSAEVYSPKSKTVLLLPCSARKPYLTSKTHRTIRNAVGRLIRGVNEIIISSPLVVPRELELVYPAINYDTPVTGYWSEEEINFVAERLASILIKGEFETIIAHVEGGYSKAVEKALSIAGMDCIFTAEGNVLSSESLSRLRLELEKADKGAFDLYEEIFRHACLYQFGMEVGGRPRGRYPELELFDQRLRVARIDARYGCLEPDFMLAEKLLELDRYAVKIDDFDPKGTIFAPAVLEADSRIKPGDYVVFYNSTMIGVGRALMFGDEMVEATKGYAVEVRRKRRNREQ
jgi:archaeosine synthase